MSMLFSTVNGSALPSAKSDIPSSTFYSTAFEQGIKEQFLTSLYRMSEYSLAKEYDPELNPYIPRKEAIDWAKNEGVNINFDYDPTSDEMSLLVERKIAENDRQAILAAGTTGAGRIAGRMGVQFLGSILSPVDLPLMFLPIVGSGAKAVQATSVVSRIAARGLVTEEVLAARGLAMKGYTAAIIEGTVGQAITEIPLMISNQQSEIDYTGSDFVTNIALGGVFGAGINTLRLGVNGIRNMQRRLTPETQENMMAGAQDDFLRGRDIDPGRYVDLDDEVGATKTLTNTVRDYDAADAKFKENYATLSPKQKDLYEFNKGNKLVDGNGLPVIVYHGRTWQGDQFDPTTLGKNTGASSAKEGFFFAGSPKTSQYYILKSEFQNDPRVSDIMDRMDVIQKELRENPNEANEILKSEIEALGNEAADRLGVDSVFREGGNVSAFMVSMKNPKIVDFNGEFHRPQTYKQVIAEAKAAGHDGVVIRNTFDGGPLDDIYVAFDQNSIKSAYEYRIVREANNKVASNQQAIADYKAREEKKAQARAQILQKEIDDGKMVPQEQIKPHRDQPDEAEFAAMDEELDFLRGLDLEEEDWNKMTGRMADTSIGTKPTMLTHYSEKDFTSSKGPMWFSFTDKNDFMSKYTPDGEIPNKQKVQIKLSDLEDYFYDPYDSIKLNANIVYGDEQFLKQIRELVEEATDKEVGIITKENKIDFGDDADEIAEETFADFQQLIIQDTSLQKKLNSIFEDLGKRNPKVLNKIQEGSTIGVPDREAIFDKTSQEFSESGFIDDRPDTVPLSEDKFDPEWEKFADELMPDSKVRDKSGNLIKLYHGGEKGITSFDQLKRPGSAYKQNSLHSEGIWFTPNKGEKGVQEDEFMSSYASTYALNYPEGEIYEVYVNITNPKKIGQEEANYLTLDELVAQGYDGAYTIDTGFWIATDPKQIQFVPKDTFPSKQPTKSEWDSRAEKLRMFSNDLTFDQWHKLTNTPLFGGKYETSTDLLVEGFRLYMPDIAKAFDTLLEIDPTLNEIPVRFDKDLMTNENAWGLYDASIDTITLNGSSSPKTFLHELVHGSAVRRFRKDLSSTMGSVRTTVLKGDNYLKSLIDYSKKTKNKPMAKLVQAYELAVKKFETDYDGNLRKYLNGNDEVFFKELEVPFYGLLNFDEFIAEGLTNRTFQLFLQSIPAVKGSPKTLLESFVDTFREFFFMKTTWEGQKGTTTLLDEVLQDYSEMVKQGIRKPTDYLKSVQKMSSADVNAPLLQKVSNCLLL